MVILQLYIFDVSNIVNLHSNLQKVTCDVIKILYVNMSISNLFCKFYISHFQITDSHCCGPREARVSATCILVSHFQLDDLFDGLQKVYDERTFSTVLENYL